MLARIFCLPLPLGMKMYLRNSIMKEFYISDDGLRLHAKLDMPEGADRCKYRLRLDSGKI